MDELVICFIDFQLVQMMDFSVALATLQGQS
jgi:hypothetical protein